jgi:mannose-6-phosphate isomerase-like protein (cupin superfamily)
MTRNSFLVALLTVSLFDPAAWAESKVPPVGAHAAVRSVAEVMSRPPLVEAENSYKGWVLEKSEDFGVVLIEVVGTIPLHMHPDGNRRMFLIEGEMRMLGGEHEMRMKPGDFMYLPRNHHHKVWLAPNVKRALFVLIDNPPVSIANVVWIEPVPNTTTRVQISGSTDQACNWLISGLRNVLISYLTY